MHSYYEKYKKKLEEKGKTHSYICHERQPHSDTFFFFLAFSMHSFCWLILNTCDYYLYNFILYM